ncbi:conserved hypothetical protein [Vibrio parahaemolyticus AN-5034]|nr:conserved hypothetical protein [Vibrio parahaemolyticus AN-5034]
MTHIAFNLLRLTLPQLSSKLSLRRQQHHEFLHCKLIYQEQSV